MKTKKRHSVKVPRIKTKRNKAKSNAPSEDDKWYYYGPNKTKRLRYKFCLKCDYKTYSKPLLIKHAKVRHPYSTNNHTIRKTLNNNQVSINTL